MVAKGTVVQQLLKPGFYSYLLLEYDLAYSQPPHMLLGETGNHRSRLVMFLLRLGEGLAPPIQYPSAASIIKAHHSFKEQLCTPLLNKSSPERDMEAKEYLARRCSIINRKCSLVTFCQSPMYVCVHSFFFIRTMVLNEKTLKFPKKN